MLWNIFSIFCLSFVSITALDIKDIVEDGIIKVIVGEPLYVKIHEDVKYQILQADNINRLATFLISEVHSDQGNLTLSITKDPLEFTAVTGRDIGVVTILEPYQTLANWFLFTNNYTGFALIYVKEYMSDAPLAGGCNQEFNLEIDSNIQLTYPNLLTKINFQWANVGVDRITNPPNCENVQLQSSMEYYVYIYFMDETKKRDLSYLETVEKMISVDGILENAVYVKTIKNNNIEKSDLSVVSYPCVSAVVNLIVYRTFNGITSSSSYVPTVINPDLLQCEENKKNIVTILISCTTILLGFLLCFFGHRYFKTGLFVFGAITGFLIAHITVNAVLTNSFAVVLGVNIVSAFICGMLWLLIWTLLGIPVISVLLVSLVAGYLVSCIVFFTPFGNLQFWENNFNYGMVFASWTMLLPVIFLAYTKLLNIICCALVGSYAIVFSIDILTYGIMRYILLNSVHRMIYTNFNKALAITPFQKNDIILAVFWVGIFLAGLIFQLCCEKGRAPFPPSRYFCSSPNRTVLPRELRVNNEREPLLPAYQPDVPYGAVVINTGHTQQKVYSYPVYGTSEK